MALDESSGLTRRDSPVGQYQFYHDWEHDDSISTSVILNVAKITGIPLKDLRPLYEAIDPDALDQVVASLRGRGQGEVRFVYNGYQIAVNASGVIEIRSTT